MHIAKLKRLFHKLNNGLKAEEENNLPDPILICKLLYIVSNKFKNFRSSRMLFTKNTDKTVDKLTNQLCMYEKNFIKSENQEKSAQKAIAVRIDSN